MDAATLAACVKNQRNAAAWLVRGACRQFAIDDQEVAARLYRADRLLRGLED